MSTHIKIIGWLHIVFGLFGLLLPSRFSAEVSSAECSRTA